MKGLFSLLLCSILAFGADAQHGPQVRRIYFNLYTDSIKTQLNYYVNVEAELSNGRFLPMDTSQIIIEADHGRMAGNEWVAPKQIGFDRVHFLARLKSDPSVQEEITVYLKRAIDPRDDPAAGDIEFQLPVVPKELQRRR